jgi:predicted outer membrane repeat protein
LLASGVYLGACTARGGNGGKTIDYLVFDGANGGHGVDGDAASQTRFVASSLVGGGAGECLSCSVDGVDGSPTAGAGLVIPYAGSARVFTAERITGDRELWNVSVSGVPGDRVFLVDNDRPTLTAAQPVLGVTLVPQPPGALAQLGVIPASGVLSVQARIPGLPAGASTRQRFVQGLVLDSAGQSWPSTPLLRVELSRFGGADCDANGRNDALDVVRGLAPDADRDLAPDACALDCNNNAQSDVTDVLNGLSLDRNDNLVPDVCETATTVYVDVNAPAGGDGSVHAPFRALRPAIAAALPGAVVLVRDGVYSSSADREVDTRGKSFTLRSSGGAAACSVDPGGAGRALRAFGGSNLVVEGLTFRNGAALAPLNESLLFAAGGAIYSDSGQLVVRDCVFENNTSLAGGALALRNGRIERCSFVGNSAPAGGGAGAVDCSGPVGGTGSLSVIESEFRGNQADSSGGALRVAAVSAVLDGCRFVENSGALGAAVAYFSASTTALDVNVFNCLFAGNVATNGGALYFSSTSTPYSTLRAQNSTFVGNVAASQGGAAYFTGRGFFVFENNIQRGNSSGSGAVNRAAPAFGPIELHVSRNCVQGGAAAFQGGLQFYSVDNFDLDPLFLAPAGIDGNPATFADNDYRLPPLSPCVDAGDASLLAPDLADRDNDGDLLEALPRDLAGATRRSDDPLTPDSGPAVAPALDLGAFERVP